MRKFLILSGIVVCLSLSASAQDLTAALDTSTLAGNPAVPATLDTSSSAEAPAVPAPAPRSIYDLDRDPFQLGLGFQYQHFHILGQSFHDLGYNADVTMYLNNWYGIEGTAVMGFGGRAGAPTLNLDAKSVFIGGGPHVVLSNKSRFEPWVHVLVGWEHFRFTQTGKPLDLGSNSDVGFEAGVGVDYHFGGRAAWRVQGDFIGSHFGSKIDANYSIGTGLVFNF